ncbi:MAG: ribonuclease H-like domain-containing protein [Tissierellia bacterium]|nr:ribonuclease H-like domain-containing protein [Tissierellia bacterium]
MKIYNHILNPPDYKFNFKNFSIEDICFLDIETTGLSKENNLIYLIGLIHYNKENSSWNLVQYFADSKNEEKNILKEFNCLINNFELLITYNGLSFDIPFIDHRLNKNGLKSNLKKLKNFDIYRRIKKESPYLELENLRLKTVEKSLGIFRDDKYTGKDCIKFYYEYLDSKDERLLERILKHNYDDLYYLVPVMKIFDIVEDAKTIPLILQNREVKIKIRDIDLKGDMFQICSESNIKVKDIIYYTDEYNFQWIENKLKIRFESKKGMITPTKECIFVNVSNWPFKKNLKDLSQYMVPNNIILLKVEEKFVMDNIKLILNEMILSSI